MNNMKEDPEIMIPEASHSEGPYLDNAITEDAVFGTITREGPNYRNVGWVGTSILMMKCQIGLGVLSIPAAFDALGLVPGVICLLTIAGITTWSNYIIGVFKVNHPEVYGIDDATKIMFGPIGREVLSVGFSLYLMFSAASGILGISIGLNSVSTHGACTSIFVAVGAIGVICLASIRTLSRVSWLAWAGLISLLSAILIVTISVGIQDRPASAPSEGPWTSDYEVVAKPSFTSAIQGISTFIFAYAGAPLFFPIACEMRDPRQYPKALWLCQAVVTATYVTIGVVVYYYCGSYVASPALGSAGRTIQMVAYGIALPGLFVSATLSTHVVSKYFFVRMLRGSRHLASNTVVHWSTWLGFIVAVVIVAYCIASGIPVFGDLVSLVGALLGTLQTFQPFGCMWLYDNWTKDKRKRSIRWKSMVLWSVFVIVSGTFLMVAGTYGSVVGIIESLAADGASRPWSCADNSNSV